MVTRLVCIWSVGSETDVHKRQRGEGVVETEREMEEGGERSLHGGDVKSRFSCTEENISPFLSLPLSQTHLVSLPTPSCGNSTASL